jgi:type III restriction enzyme
MVRRVCPELGTKKNIVVRTMRAHHCYRRKPDGEDVKLTGDDRKGSPAARGGGPRRISGIEAVKAKIGVKSIYDLSATPFFLRGSGWPQGRSFRGGLGFLPDRRIEAGSSKCPACPWPTTP